MESSNQGTQDGTNPRQQIPEKGTIKKTTARTKVRKLIETSKKNTPKETAKSQKYEETHEKKKQHCSCVHFRKILPYFLTTVKSSEKGR